MGYGLGLASRSSSVNSDIVTGAAHLDIVTARVDLLEAVRLRLRRRLRLRIGVRLRIGARGSGSGPGSGPGPGSVPGRSVRRKRAFAPQKPLVRGS